MASWGCQVGKWMSTAAQIGASHQQPSIDPNRGTCFPTASLTMHCIRAAMTMVITNICFWCLALIGPGPAPAECRVGKEPSKTYSSSSLHLQPCPASPAPEHHALSVSVCSFALWLPHVLVSVQHGINDFYASVGVRITWGANRAHKGLGSQPRACLSCFHTADWMTLTGAKLENQCNRLFQRLSRLILGNIWEINIVFFHKYSQNRVSGSKLIILLLARWPMGRHLLSLNLVSPSLKWEFKDIPSVEGPGQVFNRHSRRSQLSF